MCCWRPHFEGLSQHLNNSWEWSGGCWRPHFEGLSQPKGPRIINYHVVEDPILRGYHNILNAIPFSEIVVEDPILRGYHNLVSTILSSRVLLKTPF